MPADQVPPLARLLDFTPHAVARLTIYEVLLRKWQKVENLVAPGTLDDVWQRHFADSAQILDLLPHALRWADLGSGAGFPGMVLAILLADRPGAAVHLIESNQRKAAFLREVSRETSAPALVHAGRIESVVDKLDHIAAVTARALAPLPALLAYADPLLKKGAIGVFPKGRNVAAELTAIPPSDRFTLTLATSQTDRHGRIVIVRPVAPPPPQFPGAARAR